MKLPQWFRIGWWVLLTGMLSWALCGRYADFAAGHGTSIDLFILLVWTGLMLAPLFQEVSILGFKLGSPDDLFKTAR